MKSLESHLLNYCNSQRVRGYAEGTVRNTTAFVGTFIQWCQQNDRLALEQIDRHTLENYQHVLYIHRKGDGKPLSIASQHNRMTIIAGFFKWLYKQGVLPTNPASGLELPRLGQRLPKTILTASEMEQVISKAPLDSPKGMRDRAILETLYCTGMRRSELIGLKLFDIDYDRQTLRVRQGKGRKDRLLPLSARTADWILRYQEKARPLLLNQSPDKSDLFLRHDGLPLSAPALGNLIHNYIKNSDIGKSGSCHVFRHTVATLMLENGADIRYVQQLLGHARLQTTEIYTHVNIRALIEVHRRTHPTQVKPRKL